MTFWAEGSAFRDTQTLQGQPRQMQETTMTECGVSEAKELYILSGFQKNQVYASTHV